MLPRYIIECLQGYKEANSILPELNNLKILERQRHSACQKAYFLRTEGIAID